MEHGESTTLHSHLYIKLIMMVFLSIQISTTFWHRLFYLWIRGTAWSQASQVYDVDNLPDKSFLIKCSPEISIFGINLTVAYMYKTRGDAIYSWRYLLWSCSRAINHCLMLFSLVGSVVLNGWMLFLVSSIRKKKNGIVARWSRRHE